jgi:hypothetical protein
MPHLTMLDLASRKMPKKWISKATANSHGQFRHKAEAAGETTREFAKEHEHDSGKTGQQARLAETLMGMPHSKKRDRPKQLKEVYSHGR